MVEEDKRNKEKVNLVRSPVNAPVHPTSQGGTSFPPNSQSSVLPRTQGGATPPSRPLSSTVPVTPKSSGGVPASAKSSQAGAIPPTKAPAPASSPKSSGGVPSSSPSHLQDATPKSSRHQSNKSTSSVESHVSGDSATNPPNSASDGSSVNSLLGYSYSGSSGLGSSVGLSSDNDRSGKMKLRPGFLSGYNYSGSSNLSSSLGPSSEDDTDANIAGQLTPIGADLGGGLSDASIPEGIISLEHEEDSPSSLEDLSTTMKALDTRVNSLDDSVTTLHKNMMDELHVVIEEFKSCDEVRDRINDERLRLAMERTDEKVATLEMVVENVRKHVEKTVGEVQTKVEQVERTVHVVQTQVKDLAGHMDEVKSSVEHVPKMRELLIGLYNHMMPATTPQGITV